MRLKLLSVLVVFVMLLTCVSVPASAAGPGPTGKLVILSAETFTGSWDPTGHTVLANMHAEWNCYDRLVDLDPTTQQLTPRLATEWKWIDPMTLEVKLRQGVKFHDGKVFDATDVKASLEKYSDPKSVASSWWPQQVTVEVVDPATARIKAPKPFASLLFVLASTEIASADDFANPDRLKARMNGTGPFKFVKYENNAITFEANTDYWDGAPKLKEFVYQYVADPAARLTALQTGEAQITERVESEQVPLIEADKNLVVVKHLATENKAVFYTYPIKPMENNTLRQALSYAIDRNSIVTDIMQGFGKLAESHLSPEQWGWAPAANLPTYDPKKAADLLTQAGYPGGKGLDGLVYYTSVGFYPKTKEYGEVIVQNWSDVGVKVEFRPMEVGTWLKYIYEPSLPMADAGWAPPNLDPDATLYALFRSRGPKDQSHACYFRDADVNAAIDAEGQETDLAKRADLLKTKTLPLLADKVPIMPLFTSMLIWAETKNVQGFAPRATSVFDLKNVSLSE
jgi:peptide/nickel transport system substrate-binding protein